MTQGTDSSPSTLEERTDFYVRRIQQIDSILADPVKTLLSAAKEIKVSRFSANQIVYFPPWISEGEEPKKGEHLMTWSLCSATLQRIWRLRRRFNWLSEKEYQSLQDKVKKVVTTFAPQKTSSFHECAKILNSHAFGGLNPLTASQVFRVFLNSSEAEAHSGVGFLAFFSMLWALRRRFRTLNIGAAIEPWEPSAYVTANCLLPIKTLERICRRRAALLDEVSGHLKTIQDAADGEEQSKHWKSSLRLDSLAGTLLDLSELVTDREGIRECAKFVEETTTAKNIKGSNNNTYLYREVCSKVALCISALGKSELAVLKNAEEVLRGIRTELIPRLNGKQYGSLKRLFGLRFADEYVTGEYADAYWEDLRIGANESLSVCANALGELKQAAQKLGHGDAVLSKLKCLAKANVKVADLLGRPVDGAARWCRSVVDREIAHATAGNLTHFDPSELISGIAVAVRWNLMTRGLDVSNAISKALLGARGDGSWSPGQPFYSDNNATSISTRTSDIVWTLTSVIEIHPDVDVADDALFRYIDWLDRTRIELNIHRVNSPTNGEPKSGTYCGWASDRLWHPRKIHLATTALSINALLEIRDLAEYRLWALCKKRFPVVPVNMHLGEIQPVDLGANHSVRLNCRIAVMARKMQGDEYASAEYSLVLHGPPGSSKTIVAKALSAEAWKTSSRWARREPRLVRITPADFTGMGEDRVDAEARLIFDLLSHVRGVTIFFDEIDDLLRRRGRDTALRFLDLIVPAMLNRLSDLRECCPRQEICFVLATNYVEKIEPALIRKGRIDRLIAVVPPDWDSRRAIIKECLNHTPRSIQNIQKIQNIAEQTAGWSYLMIKEACREMREKQSEWQKILAKSTAPDPNYKYRLAKHNSWELRHEEAHYNIAMVKEFQPEWQGKLEETIWIEEGRPLTPSLLHRTG